ncbi:TIR domain-containing protein [Burkholderia sp. S171]|uniref:TIR domain-containing protein n=1 Tax=Burkholderia sp. S171 TaxID=1641860 RepID=UPI001C20757E|nr:TIR domain-containing protein [Burkholderia sp. S171]
MFIVHGHNVGVREEVARFVATLGLEPVILHEQANQGRTILTKFQEEAATAGFAIVLLTGDDRGAWPTLNRNSISHVRDRTSHSSLASLPEVSG